MCAPCLQTSSDDHTKGKVDAKNASFTEGLYNQTPVPHDDDVTTGDGDVVHSVCGDMRLPGQQKEHIYTCRLGYIFEVFCAA
jgi:hypothetical protein